MPLIIAHSHLQEIPWVQCKHGTYHKTLQVHDHMILQIRDVRTRPVTIYSGIKSGRPASWRRPGPNRLLARRFTLLQAADLAAQLSGSQNDYVFRLRIR